MSLHKSKGLSAPFVFVAGCVEGLLPGRADPALTHVPNFKKIDGSSMLVSLA
jgi:superfamily I DNA/RNA helicase